jgi:hypothetical protein
MFDQRRVKGYRHPAITINSRGKARDAKTRIFGQRVVVPAFEIYSSPTIRIAEVKRRRFNIIDRMPPDSRRHPIRVNSRGKTTKRGISVMDAAVQRARMQIMQQEDENIFKILDSIADKGFE